MILVLVYHRILASQADDFFAITETAFGRQLEILQACGRRSTSFRQLTQEGVVADSVIVTLDDGTADHVRAAALLQERGMCGTFFIPTADIDRPRFLSREQIRALVAAGHEICPHSHEHKRMDRLAGDELREQVSRSIGLVTDLTGAAPACFAPPGGITPRALPRIVREAGVPFLRTMRWGYNRRFDAGRIEVLPVTRFVTPKRFEEMVRGQRRLRRRVSYLAKEAAKLILPFAWYAKLRNRPDAESMK